MTNWKCSLLKDSTGDNGAAVFTAVTDLSVIHRFKCLEVASFHTLSFITLRAVAICQFFLVNGQMAMPASHFIVTRCDQDKVLVST